MEANTWRLRGREASTGAGRGRGDIGLVLVFVVWFTARSRRRVARAFASGFEGGGGGWVGGSRLVDALGAVTYHLVCCLSGNPWRDFFWRLIADSSRCLSR